MPAAAGCLVQVVEGIGAGALWLEHLRLEVVLRNDKPFEPANSIILAWGDGRLCDEPLIIIVVMRMHLGSHCVMQEHGRAIGVGMHIAPVAKVALLQGKVKCQLQWENGLARNWQTEAKASNSLD